MGKALRFVADMLLAAACVYMLMVAADGLTYPIMDICNAIGPLFGR